MADYTLEEWIASRGISIEDAIACGLGETDTPQSDVHPSMDYLDGFKGVVIPYFNSDGSPLEVDGIPFARMRRLGDVPKGAAKYVQGSGTGVHVYLCPFVDWGAIFADPKVPIVVTEGEAKAIAACSQGIACIALGGVSSTRDSVTGEYLPGLDGCKWRNRIVYVCFDSDAQQNPDVFAAQEAIRSELSVNRGSDVRIINLPGKPVPPDHEGNEQPDEKMGIDDFLLWKGLASFRQLLHATPSASKLDKAIMQINASCALIDDEEAVYDEKTDAFYSMSWFKDGSDYAKIKLPVVGMGKNGPVERPPIIVAKEWPSHQNARRYTSTVFKPGEPRVIKTGRGPLLNRWQGFREAEGNVEPFLDLTDFIFSELEEETQGFALKLLAYKAQNPGRKVPIAIMLVGSKGSGKSMWCELVQKAFAPASKMLQPTLLLSDYNSYVDRNVLLFIDEVTPRVMDQSGEMLKLLISQPEVMLNEKYRPMKPVDNLGLYIVTSNYPEAASFSRDERRYFVVNTPDKKDGEIGEAYYRNLVTYKDSDCGPAIMHFLLNMDLQGWEPPIEAPMTGERYNAYREGLTPVAALAEQILTADVNIVQMWIESAMEWASSMKANPPANAPMSLMKKIMQVEAVMPHWPIRPFYSMSEIGLLFPGLSETLMGNRAARHRNYTPEQISSQLRTSGVKTLRNKDDVRGFRYGGVIEPFLIIADVNNEDLKKPLTQAEFEDLMLTFGTYAELPGTRVASTRIRQGS
ncbi:DUF3854 domain-containing protein [bacterium]|nr:DUF3854 domain-containing protein [bacterium]